MIPKDPAILLSFVNTKLRDEYDGLHDLCASLNTDESELRTVLGGLGYHYDPARNRFV